MKIDAHQHFWNYNTSDFGWIDDTMKNLENESELSKIRTQVLGLMAKFPLYPEING